jgi:signal transduction histidine kinase
MAVHIFHIIQEGLTNAAKHSRASKVCAVVRVSPTHEGGSRSDTARVEVTLEDDGVGMASEGNGKVGFGLGLIGIRERALALGGRLSILTEQKKGMTFTVTIPSSEPAS